MKLTKGQRQALDVLRQRGYATRNAPRTALDPPTIHYLTEAHLFRMGLIKAVPMVRHCDTCDCDSGKVQLTETGLMVARAATP